MKKVNLYQIAYSEKTLAEIKPGYLILDNTNSERNDWREYWPIRNFLLGKTLDDEAFYGFFSPRFEEKTGLSHAQVTDYVRLTENDVGVVSFSPQPDMGAFFLNIFEQEELFQPGFVAISDDFFESIGISTNIEELVMDSRHIIFSNYFVAKPIFWKSWLEINEKLFRVCEGADSALKQALTAQTANPGEVQRKVFLMERIASLMLTLQPAWKVRSFNTFRCAWSASRLNQFRFEAVLSDALKIAMNVQGFDDYRDAFAKVRERLR